MNGSCILILYHKNNVYQYQEILIFGSASIFLWRISINSHIHCGEWRIWINSHINCGEWVIYTVVSENFTTSSKTVFIKVPFWTSLCIYIVSKPFLPENNLQQGNKVTRYYWLKITIGWLLYHNNQQDLLDKYKHLWRKVLYVSSQARNA